MIAKAKISDFRRAEQELIQSKRDKYERRYYSYVREVLDKQAEPLINVIERTDSINSLPAVSPTPFIELLINMYIAVGPEFARMSYDTFKAVYVPGMILKREDPVMYSNWIETFRMYALEAAAIKVTSITETTREYIARIIARAGEEGLSIQNTVKLLRSRWKQLSRYRATVITRSEILSISNYAQYTGATTVSGQVGLDLNKTWLSAHDRRTRNSHRAASGQTVDINDPFIINGYQAMFPGDSSLGMPASEIILCRCSHYYEPKE